MPYRLDGSLQADPSVMILSLSGALVDARFREPHSCVSEDCLYNSLKAAPLQQYDGVQPEISFRLNSIWAYT
jgi:hypothetical protein